MNEKVAVTAVIHLEGDLYVAECPEIGTVSQGTSIEEAINNLQEATELYLEEFPQDPESNLRYEVEVQLGKTDESHIFRTIEYWDLD